jgi:serine/threonine protein kinase
MPIGTGTRLGSYELLAQIGAGGMGEVYKAHDTKLGRDVAIKVLPEAFAHDPERLSRFQREAKMLASLNHPNIAAIYGLEDGAGRNYLVMELVPGETLAERVKRDGAVPIEEALAIAKQIAEALEAAHEKGIIHRDLKPANVKVTPEGKVKVLDFGLAKAFAGEGTDSNPSQSPTLSAVATMQGVLLGTAGYMSPEQARGKSVDKRTDIWAFGCVLYELLTGKQAFQGETTTEILAAVLRGEPDWQALPPATAAKIRDLLRRCLQKDLNKRCRDAGDVRIEIEEALAAPMPTGPPITNFPPKTVWLWALGMGVAGLVVAAIAGLVVWNLRSSSVAPVSRSMFSLPPGEQLAGLDRPALAISPDGNRMVYVASRGSVQQLYLRSMDSFEAKPILGTEGAAGPFFSPDSQWVGFFAESKLKKASINGGAPVTLWDAKEMGPWGAAWGSNDMIVVETGGLGNGQLSAVPAAGGTPQPLTTVDSEKGEVRFGWPDFLPGAKAVLFTASPNVISWAEARLSLYVPQTGKRRTLNQIGMRPRYARSGHLVYAQGGSLMAVPFDPGRLELTGTPIPVMDGVMESVANGFAQYSFSDNGTLAYIPGAIPAAQSKLVWVDRQGTEETLAAPMHSYAWPRVSPDGTRVAVEIAGSAWRSTTVRIGNKE